MVADRRLPGLWISARAPGADGHCRPRPGGSIHEGMNGTNAGLLRALPLHLHREAPAPAPRPAIFAYALSGPTLGERVHALVVLAVAVTSLFSLAWVLASA